MKFSVFLAFPKILGFLKFKNDYSIQRKIEFNLSYFVRGHKKASKTEGGTFDFFWWFQTTFQIDFEGKGNSLKTFGGNGNQNQISELAEHW